MARTKLRPRTLLGVRSMKKGKVASIYVDVISNIVRAAFGLGEQLDILIISDIVFIYFDKTMKEKIREILLITHGSAAERSFNVVEVWFPVRKIFQ